MNPPPAPASGDNILEWAKRMSVYVRRIRPVKGIGTRLEETESGIIVSLAKDTQTPPFFTNVASSGERAITVTNGICYVYGIAYPVEEAAGYTTIILDDDTERVWVQFPIEPESDSPASIQYGTGSDLQAVNTNQWGYRVLAHIQIGDNDEISSFSRRWVGGDMYFSD